MRVLTVQSLGDRTKIEAVGTRSQPQQFYSRILSADDLAHVRIKAETGRDLKGNNEAFFLAMEAHRIRYAYQFDSQRQQAFTTCDSRSKCLGTNSPILCAASSCHFATMVPRCK